LKSADLEDFFENHPRMALDTSPFVYWLEENPTYFDVSKHIFKLVEERKTKVTTSTLTLTEALVLPYRMQDWRRVYRINAVLDTYPHLEWLPPTVPIARRAAQIRAAFNLRTPDAVHAATALISGATAIITNDPIFRRVPSLEVLLLDEML
jgi:predicted nucleic acid-binding protein